ncbi:uncharacterized protein DUF3243 [Thermodesulfitimonas autotrophica]|uniref:Uncharacterized protein DUF3243 n=1 Tax=Thermodesulfitimonas autotrophica TaxID=1894989 RepID=A0A3N5BM36_9THEO|nr:DUF3243 family protein [Thermodesulfitimonas autotrophica]RPF46805.1 uncharacterized protein DUF3243 [Thermodesulfitimonas autotrophica]
MERMEHGERMALENFPKELAAKIREGKAAGLSDEQLVDGIINLGDVLAKFVKPDSPEEALLKEMWRMATPAEKRTMASLVLRLGSKVVH